jgi:hypothetical protein
MPELSVEWVHISPGRAVYCDRPVDGNRGRRVEERSARDRRVQRRCSWFLIQAGRLVALRIRLVNGPRITRTADSPSHVRCNCGAIYEFEEVPIVHSAEAMQ